jgi:hypothetical protein
MNMQNARTIMTEAARLMELTARFQARCGANHTLGYGTPQDAWALYDDIMNSQSIIANLLDPTTLANPHHPYGRWWDRYDVMSAPMAQQLINEISHLMTCVAYMEEGTAEGGGYAVDRSQHAIAGMLHPKSYDIVSDPELERQAG